MCEHTAVSEDFLFMPSVFGAWSESLINHSTLLGLHKGGLLPGVPTLKTQSWWPQPLAGPFLKACLSAGFSPLSGQFPRKQWKWNTHFLDLMPSQDKVGGRQPPTIMVKLTIMVIFPTFSWQILWTLHLQKHKCQVNKMSFKAAEGCHKELLKERRAME